MCVLTSDQVCLSLICRLWIIFSPVTETIQRDRVLTQTQLWSHRALEETEIWAPQKPSLTFLQRTATNTATAHTQTHLGPGLSHDWSCSTVSKENQLNNIRSGGQVCHFCIALDLHPVSLITCCYYSMGFAKLPVCLTSGGALYLQLCKIHFTLYLQIRKRIDNMLRCASDNEDLHLKWGHIKIFYFLYFASRTRSLFFCDIIFVLNQKLELKILYIYILSIYIYIHKQLSIYLSIYL